MYKVKKHIGIRIFFLALFLSYFADITFFTHTHIVHGVTIVHSHFYKGLSSSQQNKKTNDHEHPDKALTLISQINAWSAIVPTIPKIPETNFLQYFLCGTHYFLSHPQSVISFFQLRAPPFDAQF